METFYRLFNHQLFFKSMLSPSTPVDFNPSEPMLPYNYKHRVILFSEMKSICCNEKMKKIWGKRFLFNYTTWPTLI